MIKKQHDIIIVEDALPQSLADECERHMNDQLDWYLMRDCHPNGYKDLSNTRLHITPTTVNTLQLGHGVFEYEDKTPWQSKYWSMFDLIMKTCVDKAVVQDKYQENLTTHSLFELQPIRIKCTMLLNNNKVKSKEYHNTIHTDNRFTNSYSGIYYVNDSDGDTIIYNEQWSETMTERPKKLTEKIRIKPKKNQFLMFDGLYYHTSTNPIESEKRMVVNMNFLNGKEAHKYA